MEICETGHRDKLSEAENRDTKQKVFKMYLTNTSRFEESVFFVKQQHFPSRKTNQIPENKSTKWSQNIYFISLNIGLN